jgi:hypothetical protein
MKLDRASAAALSISVTIRNISSGVPFPAAICRSRLSITWKASAMSASAENHKRIVRPELNLGGVMPLDVLKVSVLYVWGS